MSTRRIIAGAILLMLAALALSIPVMAGNIEGYIYNPFKGVQSSLSVNVNHDGNLYPAGAGQGTTWEATPVGWYGISGLAPGNYTMLLHECDNWPRKIIQNIAVPASGTTYVDYRYDNPNHETGIFWDGNLRTEWCQSFIATGTSLTQVGYSQAIEFGPDTTITIHEGSPDGPQIGPSRIIPTVVVNPSAAYWSNGEVPLVPGKEYVVKFTVRDGHRPFLGVGRIQGGIAYPDGRTWSDGNIVADPIRMWLCQDDDGIISVVNTKKTNSGSLPLVYRSVTRVGQTFKAKGTSILSVSLLVGNTNGQTLQCSIHDGPGLTGEGGPQIGVAKNIKPIDWNERSGCVWKPGEVPVTPGHQYYVKISKSTAFTIYYVDQNEYQDGVLYLDSNILTDAELSTTITAEEFSGSLNRATVKLQNISVTRAANSATITWNTDVATTTNYVEYAASNPYRSKVNDTAGGTSHSVTINGLAANTLYHYRVVSKAANYWDARSRDFVFVTEPSSNNLVLNPSFEDSTASPWVSYTFGGNDIGVRKNLPPGAYPDWFGATAHSGNNFFGGVCNGLKLYAGIFQQIQTTPGRQLNARAWVWTWQMDTFGAFMQWTCHARIGIDPTGGTDPASLNIIWSPATVAQDLFSDAKGSYTEAWARAMAASTTATIFIEGGSTTATAWTIFAFDDVFVTEIPPYIADTIADAKAQPDGVSVQIADKEVINLPAAASNEYTSPLVDAVYVEETDRSSGIRLETNAALNIGDKVTVVGIKQTKASGEVYLANPMILSTTPTTGNNLKSMMTVAKNLSNVGLSNIGMLMRVSGKVAMDDQLNIYLNDGSLPGQGIKLDYRPFLTFWPEHGQKYSVTGVVSLIGSTPASATAVITPRSDFDIQLVY